MRLRVTLFTALATLVVASLVWATEPFNTSGRWACFSGTCIIGHARAPAIQLLTDGTGTAEIVLPNDSISTAEVLDDTLDFSNFSDTMTLDADTAITVATGNEFTINAAAQVGIDELLSIIVDQADDADATDVLQAIRIELASESGDANDTIHGIVMTVEEGTANTIIDNVISIDNEETTASTLTDAILITSSGVNAGVTDAIDASAANITNAINVGANVIMGDNSDYAQIGGADNVFRLSVDGTNTAKFQGADASGAANTSFDTSGAGAIEVGSSDVTAVTITTDDTGDGTDLVLPNGSVGRAEMTKAGRSTFNICGEATTINNNTVFYGPSITLLANTSGGQTCDINAAGNTTEATADAPIYTNQAVEVLAMTCRNEGDANADISFTLRTAAGATVPSVTCTISDGERDCVADVQTTTDIAAAATVAVAAASTSDVGDGNGFVCQVEVAF